MAKCGLVDFGCPPASDVYVDLPDELVSCKMNRLLVQDVVHWQLAKRRSGTANTKRVGDVAATTKKPWRQKGTGRARHGNLVAAQFRGGAVALGPRPRSFAHSISKKVRRSALRMVISQKFADGTMFVSRGIFTSEAKTGIFVKRAAEYLGNYGSLVYCVSDVSDNLALASRNLRNVNVVGVEALNVYTLLRNKLLIVDEGAIARVVERII